MTDDQLLAARDHVMKALTQLSNVALEAKQAQLTRINSDLYYATNRAWRELEGVLRRQSA